MTFPEIMKLMEKGRQDMKDMLNPISKNASKIFS